jgi:hypothetical protein
MLTKPQFQLQLIGANVTPETVPAKELADFVEQVEAAVRAAVERDPTLAALSPDEVLVSLVGVDEGSNKLTFAVASAALLAVAAITEAVATAHYAAIPPPSQEALSAISRQAARRKWLVEFQPDQGRGIRHAVISEDHPVPAPTVAKISGSMTILGQCMRVGGAQPRAEIRLPSGDLLFIDITEEMAISLGPLLYKPVSLEGRATWEVEGWKLVEFRATRLTEYRGAPIPQTFAELAKASGGRWDNIDAAEYVRELRAGDDQ